MTDKKKEIDFNDSVPLDQLAENLESDEIHSIETYQILIKSKCDWINDQYDKWFQEGEYLPLVCDWDNLHQDTTLIGISLSKHAIIINQWRCEGIDYHDDFDPGDYHFTDEITLTPPDLNVLIREYLNILTKDQEESE